jgi:hypothetical protein
MAWFCVSGRLSFSPEHLDLMDSKGGLAALGVWTVLGAWCADKWDGADNKIPCGAALAIARSPRSIQLLVDAGLLLRDGKHYRIAGDYHCFRRDDSRPKLPRREVFERDEWLCVYCGAQVDMQSGQADHVVPRSRGGSDDISNLATACAPCNQSKGARTPAEWGGRN